MRTACLIAHPPSPPGCSLLGIETILPGQVVRIDGQHTRPWNSDLLAHRCEPEHLAPAAVRPDEAVTVTLPAGAVHVRDLEEIVLPSGTSCQDCQRGDVARVRHAARGGNPGADRHSCRGKPRIAAGSWEIPRSSPSRPSPCMSPGPAARSPILMSAASSPAATGESGDGRNETGGSDADPTAEARINALLATRTGGQSPVTVAAAESLTGGNVSARITAISGSSGYFLGGIVAYSNAAKASLLGVSEETLATRGAVSAECAREMAEGARAFGADVAVATTGIAGTWRDRAQAGRSGLHRPRRPGRRDHRGVPFPGGRAVVTDASTEAALLMLLRGWSAGSAGIATTAAVDRGSPGSALDLDQTARRLGRDAAEAPVADDVLLLDDVVAGGAEVSRLDAQHHAIVEWRGSSGWSEGGSGM